MGPFDSYTGNIGPSIKSLKGNNSRFGYALKLVQDFGAEPRCAYCGTNLLEPYENWLLLTLDHVIPQKLVEEGKDGKEDGHWAKNASKEELRIRKRWINSAANCVICCSACNSSHSKIQIDENTLDNPPRNDSLEQWELFIEKRNDLFTKKRELAISERVKERARWNEEWRCPIICGNREG